MEAKASRNPGLFTRRHGSFRDRLVAFLPHMEPEANGNGRAASNGNGRAASNGKVRASSNGRVRAHGSDAGARLESYLNGSGATLLHHLQLPGHQGEIDNLIVGPAGVTVVEGRFYGAGKAKFEKGQLRIGRRNRTPEIKRVLDQAAAVRELLADTRYAQVPVDAAIAVSQAGGIPSVGTRDGRRVIVWGTGLIAREASRPGPLTRRRVSNLATRLGAELSA